MDSSPAGSPSAQGSWKPLTVFAFTAGFFFIAFIIANGSWGTPASNQMLATFQSNQTAVDLTGVFLGIAVAAGIAFFALLGGRLHSKGAGFALAATLLVSTGFAVTAISTAIFVAVLNGIVNAGSAPVATEAAYQAAVWDGAYQTLGYLGAALAGLGLVMFGSLIWKSNTFPNWLAVVAFIGGIGGFASIIGVLDIINGVALLVLTFGTGVLVIRRRTKT